MLVRELISTRFSDDLSPARLIDSAGRGNADLLQVSPDPDRGGTGPNGKPSFTITQAAQQITRDGISWNGVNQFGQAATVTYSFRDTAPASMPDDTGGFSRFTAAQITAAELSLQSWSDVANITFTRIGGTGYSNGGQIIFGNYSTGKEGAAAFAYFPTNGDVWVNISQANNQTPGLGSYGRQTLTHELGHSIGLDHPGDYNASDGDPDYATDAVYYEDSTQYSLMSYWSETETGADFHGYYASAPLIDDIAAVQRLYGANMTTRTGDTTYGFNSNAGREWYLATGADAKVVFAVWDAGGTDTFDFSGFASAQVIDLGEGAFSSVGGMIGNVGIAMGVTIENAIGGTGSDVITGNAANNRLTGNGGTDTLSGMDGADTLIAGIGAGAVLTAASNQARATMATALSVNGVMTLAADANIAASTTTPHATVRAATTGQYEWFSVVVTSDGRGEHRYRRRVVRHGDGIV